ncbi:MAG: hypothetical protein JW719_03725 [Pirellulales bacterium]|nr:hypothetical protein [Pirellulales bacterium]
MAKQRKTADKQNEIAPLDITAIVQQAELQDLRLLTCACRIGTLTRLPSDLAQSISIQEIPKDDDPEALVVRATFTIVGEDVEGQDGIRVEASYGLIYRITSLKDFTQDHRVGFAQVIGLNNAWPYWREFVQSCTARMGLPPLTLPLVRPAQLRFTPSQDRIMNKANEPVEKKQTKTTTRKKQPRKQSRKS